MKISIPKNLLKIISKLEAENFEVFVVGGSVRNLLLKKEVVDWDLTTNARPQEILEIFPDAKYKNEFGTVLIPEKYLDSDQKGQSDFFEITTYRKEGKYSDKRRPDEVIFANKLEDDLKRRDFTINALAMGINGVDKLLKTTKKALIEIKKEQIEIVDKFQGQEDLKNKLIKTVGDPEDRIEEDALRMMRAVRLAVQLGFQIKQELFEILSKKAINLKYVSKERVGEELKKIILSPKPARGIDLLVETGLIEYVIPEIKKTIKVEQNRHHYHGPYNTVYKHMLASLEKCPSEKFEVRMASFLHDIGKPGTKQGSGFEASFHNHEYLGAKMVKKIMERLKFSREVVDKTVLLVKNHMFYYNVDEVGESGVRKVIRKVGLENIKDLIDVRIADRLGSGVPKAVPYRLRHFQFMVDKVSQDPISVKQLKINGNDLIKELKLKPGPKIGAVLEVLLMEVIENPEKNTVENLLKRSKTLIKEDLNSLREKAKQKIKKENQKQEEKIKNKHWVK
jgi:putative nucleotidyltransferase with HDIG domain